MTRDMDSVQVRLGYDMGTTWVRHGYGMGMA